MPNALSRQNIDHTADNLTNISRELNAYVTLLATYNINKSLFEKISKQHDPSVKKFIKINHKKFDKKNNDLRLAVASYMYFKLSERSFFKRHHKVIEIVDYQLNDEIIDSIKDNWKKQPIVKRLKLSSFDEVLEAMKLGILTINSFRDLDKYFNKKQAA